MALKVAIDKLDDVPEGIREHYTEVDGKFVLGVEGAEALPAMKGLRDENAKRRISEKKATTDLSTYTTAFGVRKPDEILAILDRVPELEAAAAGKIDEIKINSMVETRLGAKLGPVQRELATAKTALAERDQVIAGYQTKERTRAVHDSVRDAISKSKGFQPSATEDALILAERMFEVNEDGKVITKDGVGVTPGVDAIVWLTDLQAKRAHWWGPTSGGGAGGGGNGGGGGGVNPWKGDSWNMTEQGRIYKENSTRATQMAQAAGTTIGGPRPVGKK